MGRKSGARGNELMPVSQRSKSHYPSLYNDQDSDSLDRGGPTLDLAFLYADPLLHMIDVLDSKT